MFSFFSIIHPLNIITNNAQNRLRNTRKRRISQILINNTNNILKSPPIKKYKQNISKFPKSPKQYTINVKFKLVEYCTRTHMQPLTFVTSSVNSSMNRN